MHIHEVNHDPLMIADQIGVRLLILKLAHVICFKNKNDMIVYVISFTLCAIDRFSLFDHDHALVSHEEASL
jgi:hypothetical protein